MEGPQFQATGPKGERSQQDIQSNDSEDVLCDRLEVADGASDQS